MRTTTNFCRLLFLVIASLASPAQSQTPPTVTETAVIMFAPSVPSGAAREGSCWTTSISVTRPGAYRCMVGNSISDPCFVVPPNAGQVVCDADPAHRKNGFVVKLTKPLPDAAPPAASVAPQPWIIKLADGSICEAMTGTLPAVNGEPARWACAIYIRDQVRQTGVVTKVTPGKVWMAERFAQSAIGPPGGAERRVKAEQVPVRTIWE